MATLHEALDRATAGAGRVAAVIGEAGIGKSRIVAELVAKAAAHGATVIVGRAYASEQILPFGPWVNALRASTVVDDAVLEKLGSMGRVQLAPLLPELAPSPSAGETGYRAVFEGVARLLEHLAECHPLLLLLEDLHWADEMSARLLAFVGRQLRTWAALIVVTARDEELSETPALRSALEELKRDGGLVELPLRPLSRADTRFLVRALARIGGDEGRLERLAEQAWGASEGNPFVVVETVRAHTDGALAGAGRAALPERVRELVGQRLDQLSESARALMTVAAVIGREFEWALLQRAAGLDEDESASGVEELVRRRVLHGVGERFDFTHERIRDVAYGRVLGPRRRLLHRRVAEAMEVLFAERLGDHALALGLHYRECEVWDRAAQYLHRAGLSAIARSANREAAACLHAELEALAGLADSDTKTAHTIDALMAHETALMGLGQFQTSLDQLRRAEALARGAGDRLRLGHVLRRMGYNLGSVGNLDGAVDNAEQARAIAVAEQDVRLHVEGNVVLARALYARGDHRRAMEALRHIDVLAAEPAGGGVAEKRRRPGRVYVRFSRGWRILALAELGEFAEATPLVEEALRVGRTEWGPHGHVWAHLTVGRLCLVKGDLPRAIEVLEAGLPLCEVDGDLAGYFSRTASSLGGAYALLGRLAEAGALLERAVAHAESTGFAYGEALVVATLAETRLLEGLTEEAAVLAERAVAGACRYGQRGWEAWSRRLHGEIAARGDPPDTSVAVAHLRAAMTVAGERGMRPLVAHCRLGLGEAYRRVGEVKRGRAETAAALDAYREMEMPYWIARAEADLG